MAQRDATVSRVGDLSLEPGDLDVWVVITHDVADEAVDDYRSFLSVEERTRQGRFRLARERRTYATARALLRCTLTRYADIAAGQWRFATTRYGRPVLAADLWDHTQLTFNLSHTDGMITLAVGRSHQIGIDVENTRNIAAPIQIAERFFAIDEVEFLKKTPASARQELFFELWTLKEAYLKARGSGLTLPLDGFSITFAGRSRLQLSIDPSLGDLPARWRLWEFRPTAEHIIALCAERTFRPERLTIRRCVPSGPEEPIACAIHRDSHGLGGR